MYKVLNMYIFLQKCINSIQEAFINPLELYGALFMMGGCSLLDYWISPIHF